MPIARVALPVASDTTFDYWAPEALGVARGAVVRVQLGRRKLTGVVTGVAEDTVVAPEKLQTIDAIVAIPPVPEDILEMADFVSGYYQAPIGMAAALVVPPLPGGRAGRPRKVAPASPSPAVADEAVVALNSDQRTAMAAIGDARGTFLPFLLFGVTGSGKTDVYLHSASQAIASGGQVLMLVPEINLTPQLEGRVRAALPGVPLVLLHSGLPQGERRENWRAAAAGEARLVLGTRLAVFAPMPSLSLVIVDEEHDGSATTHATRPCGVRTAAAFRSCWAAPRRRSNRGCMRRKAGIEGSTCRGAPIRGHGCRWCDSRATGRLARSRALARRCAARFRSVWRVASSRWCSSTAAALRHRCCAPRAAGKRNAHVAARD